MFKFIEKYKNNMNDLKQYRELGTINEFKRIVTKNENSFVNDLKVISDDTEKFVLEFSITDGNSG